MSKVIFVVDDKDINLSMAKEALKDQYRVMTLPSAAKMFALIEKVTPDLILLDIEMPEMDGFEALDVLKTSDTYSSIPVIFLTSMTDATVEAKGFQMGVIDFISKPFSAPVLLNRIKSHLDIDELIRERTQQLQQKTEEIQHLKDGIIYVLSDMVEKRDTTTGGHIGRTAKYLDLMLNEMMVRGLYKDTSQSSLETLISSARLHDVGKITISDVILNKPGKLTDEEFAIMKSHSMNGMLIIDQMIERTGNVDFLQNARQFAGTHHERWDGRGYPNGLTGDDIPILGRIMAIVDVYDALVSVRPYKKGFSHEEAVQIIMEGSGTQFDPNLTILFFELQEKFKAVER